VKRGRKPDSDIFRYLEVYNKDQNYLISFVLTRDYMYPRINLLLNHIFQTVNINYFKSIKIESKYLNSIKVCKRYFFLYNSYSGKILPIKIISKKFFLQ